MNTNLINTLMLATSVGMGATTNTPTPNRAITNEYNLELEPTQTEVSGNISDALFYREYSGQNSYISVNAREIYYTGLDINDQNYSYYYAKVKDNNTKPVEYKTNAQENTIFYTTASKLILLKITGQNINTETTLTTASVLKWDTYTGLTKRYYQEILTTTKDMNQYFQTITTDTEWLNLYVKTGLYSTYNTIKYGSIGYQTTNRYKYGELSQVIANTRARTTENIQITQNKTTYIFLYEQPQYTQETTPTVNYEQTLTGSYITNILTQIKISGINAIQQGDLEVVDIGGVMFEILGMPFTFISTAFNLTIFAGTPYELNMSILFLSIFAVIVFIFIIKLIIGAIGNK